MKAGRKWSRFVLGSLTTLIVVWIAYTASTRRGKTARSMTDTGCELDSTMVADMSELTPGASAIRCQPWDVGTGVTGYVWHAPNAKAVVLLEHGWGDYSQRYVKQFSQLIPHLLAHGISVFAIDMWGNGRSHGARGATDIGGAVEDHLAARRKLREQQLPVLLLGHSVGGLVTATSALRDQTGIHGMILVAPALQWRVSASMRVVAKVFAFLLPTFSVPMPTPDPLIQSRDPHLHERLVMDPLMHMQNVSWLTVASGATTSHANWTRYTDIVVPTLVVNGTADKVTDASGGRAFIDSVRSQDKTLSLVEGGRHSLLDDPPASTEALQVILSWIDLRLPRSAPSRS